MSLFWRSAPFFARFVLVAAALLLTTIATRSIVDPVATAANDQIILNSGYAITVARIGFAGFPLAIAGFLLFCGLSPRQILTGLGFLAFVMVTLLIVRTAGVALEGGLAENRPAFIGETVFTMLATVAIVWEMARRRTQIAPAPASR